MKKLFFAIAAAAMVFATSCSKESVNEPVVNPEDIPANSFLCEIENGSATQKILSRVGDGMGTMATIEDGRYIIWENGDQISVNNGNGGGVFTNNQPTTTRAQGGRAYFEWDNGAFNATEYYAFYPSDIQNTNKGTNYGTLKQVIYFDPQHPAAELPMYAYNGSNHWLKFKNICAVLEITVPETTAKIVMHASEKLCGPFSVDANNIANVQSAGSGYTDLTIQPIDGTTFAENDVVYLAIPQGEFTGVYFDVYNAAGTAVSFPTATKPTMSVIANKIYPVTLTKPDAPTGIPDGCFYFTNQSTSASCTLSMATVGSPSNTINLKYCKKPDSGQANWSDFVTTSGYASVTINPNETVYIYSENGNNSISSSYQNYRHFTCTSTSPVADVTLVVGGKLSYLLSSDGSDKFTSINAKAFEMLFSGMTHLKDASALELPNSSDATISLPSEYYYGMFMGCSTLSSVFSKIEAGTFGNSSCCSMFESCTALQNAPLISATNTSYGTGNNASNGCFKRMFASSGITSATITGIGGKLGSTALGEMFSGCSNITTINLSVLSGTRDAKSSGSSSNQNSLYNWLDNVTTNGNINVNSDFPYVTTEPSSNKNAWALYKSASDWYKPSTWNYNRPTPE